MTLAEITGLEEKLKTLKNAKQALALIKGNYVIGITLEDKEGDTLRLSDYLREEISFDLSNSIQRVITEIETELK